MGELEYSVNFNPGLVREYQKRIIKLTWCGKSIKVFARKASEEGSP
jgi:hypothetical protein